MCGLSGYTGNTKADKHALRVLLMDNDVRGVHATGIANVEGVLDKKAIAPRTYMGYDQFDEIANSKLVMCHNRWATMKNADQDIAAHPFKINDRLIGAHNGFVPEWEFQADQLEIDLEGINVDSEIIFHHLVNKGYNPECLADIEGAMALSWIDLETKMLWLYRRSSRPLFIGEDSNKRLYYSSRENGLWILGGRGNIELEENIAYGFKNGVLVKMIPVDEPKIYIDIDKGLTAFTYGLKNDQRKLLGLKPKVATKSKKWTNNGQTYNQRFNSHTAQYGDEYEDYEQWYNKTKAKREKKKLYSASSILQGSLDELVDLTINDFDPDKSYQMTPMNSERTESKDGKNTVISMKVASSIDNKPVPDAVVFIDHPDASQYMTTKKGFVTMSVPEDKVGGFMRIGVLPYPYDELYHTSLLNLNEGEIMEVSLFIPFRSVDREALKKEKKESNSKKNSKSKVAGSTTGGSDAKIVDIRGAFEAGAQAANTGSEDEPECILDSRGYPSSWDGDGGKDDETDEYVEGNNEQSDMFRGIHDQYGYLFKTVADDKVTICDSESNGIIDIDPQEFWSYAYEHRALELYEHNFVNKYTDTLWGYYRYCGYTPNELIIDNKVRKPTREDWIAIGNIVEEAANFKQL